MESGNTLHPDGPHLTGLRVWINEQSLREVRHHAASDSEGELPGFLVGEYLYAAGATLVIVRGWVAARHTAAAHTDLPFTFETWQSAWAEVRERFPGLGIVGWFTTHPGAGVFMTSMDLRVQRTWFHQPWHLALIIDPRRGYDGLFVNTPGNEPVVFPNYLLFTAGSSGLRAAGTAPPEHPDSQTRREVAALAEPMAAPPRLRGPKAGRLRRAGLVGGAVLFLIAVLLLSSISSVYREVVGLRSEVVTLRLASAAQAPPAPVQPPAAKVEARPWVYTVRNGDTLWSISEQFYGTGTAAGRISRANGLGENAVLQPGQRLTIPSPE